MPSYTAGNVYVVTSSASQATILLPHVKSIQGIKFFAAAGSTAGTTSTAALLSNASSTGAPLWVGYIAGASGPVVDLLSIYEGDGVAVSLSGGGSLYLYGRVQQR